MDNQQFQSAVLEKLEQLTQELTGVRANMTTMEANMATKDELVEITGRITNIEATMVTKDELADVKSDLARVKEIVVTIENDHGLKLGALFDGYTQNADKLDRIEKAVAKHEEALLTKVK